MNHNVFSAVNSLRPIKAFKPEELWEFDPEANRKFIGTRGQLLWFLQYMLEQGKSARFAVKEISDKVIGAIPCSPQEYEGGQAIICRMSVEAVVYIDGNEASTGIASGTYVLNDKIERDNANAQLQWQAVGKALSWLGFGAIPGFDLSPEELKQLGIPKPTDNAPAAVPTALTHSPLSNGSTNTDSMPNLFNFPQAAPIAAAASVVSTPAPAAPVADPLVAAKQVVYPGGGVSKGKTLGEILSNPGGRANLEWIANTYVPRNEEGRAAKEAAKLILANLPLGK